mgnify:CR=1 FL=1
MAKKSPELYERVRKEYPQLIEALDGLGKAARKAGPLDAKTVQLIQLAAAAAIGSQGSVRSHARRALEAGAKAAAVRHAVVCATNVIGFPNVIAALGSIEDVKSSRRK